MINKEHHEYIYLNKNNPLCGEELKVKLDIFRQNQKNLVLITYKGQKLDQLELVIEGLSSEISKNFDLNPNHTRWFEFVNNQNNARLSEAILNWEQGWPELENWQPVDEMIVLMIKSLPSMQMAKEEPNQKKVKSLDAQTQEMLEEIITEVVSYCKDSQDISHGVEEVMAFGRKKEIKLNKDHIRKVIKTRVEQKIKKKTISFSLKGKFSSRGIWLNGKELSPATSLSLLKLNEHGFDWGNLGSGAGQLALAICLEIFKTDKALFVHEEFKNNYVAQLKREDFDLHFTVTL